MPSKEIGVDLAQLSAVQMKFEEDRLEVEECRIKREERQCRENLERKERRLEREERQRREDLEREERFRREDLEGEECRPEADHQRHSNES